MRRSLAAIAVSLTSLGAASAEPAAKDPPPIAEAVVPGVRSNPADPVVCRRIAPTGSRITTKVCKPKSGWVSTARRAPKFEEPKAVDGFDDKFAPLPR